MIVYYSCVGNTEVVAKEFQKQTGFEIQKIEEKKERKLDNIMGSAAGAFFGFKSALKPMDYSLNGFKNIFLGLQVWAGKTTPAINKYLSEGVFKDKKVWLFVTKADSKVPQEVIDSVTRRIENKGGKVVDSISFTKAWDPKKNEVLSVDEVKDSVSEWLASQKNVILV